MQSPAGCTYQELPDTGVSAASVQATAVGFSTGPSIGDCLTACDALANCTTVFVLNSATCYLATAAAVPSPDPGRTVFRLEGPGCTADPAGYKSDSSAFHNPTHVDRRLSLGSPNRQCLHGDAPGRAQQPHGRVRQPLRGHALLRRLRPRLHTG